MNKTTALKIRGVTEADCRLLWEWVNDPVSRDSAFSSEPISFPDHEAWFRAKLQDPGCTFLIVTDEEDRPVGQVRFDRTGEGVVEIDIGVAPSSRGQGLGPRVLKLACEELPAVSRRVRRVVAAIRPGNKASIRTFEKAGFRHEGQRQVKGNPARVMTMEVQSE